MANYTHAKIAFDQALGQTLDVEQHFDGGSRGGARGAAVVIPANPPPERSR